jgi:pimeloyl-ACP methyl ester carboxylesterase
MPALVPWGDEDRVTPIGQGQHLKSVLPDATLVTLPGIGHIPQLEDENRFNDALIRNLAARLAPRQ